MGIDISQLSKSAQKQVMAKLAQASAKTAMADGKKKSGSKYGAVRTWVFGLCTDSKKEADYLANCVLLCKARALGGFLYHGKLLLVEGTDKAHRAVTYTPDFVLLKKDGTYELVDTKGVETDLFRDKMKLVRERYPDISVTVEK